MNNTRDGKTIGNVALRTDISLLDDMKKARRVGKKSHCADFRVFDSQVAPLEKQLDAATVKDQKQQEALMGLNF